MDKEKLKQEIEKLRDEFSNYGPEFRKRIDHLVMELEKSELGDEGIVKQLLEIEQESLRRAEVDHPELTQMVNKIADLLSSLGI